MAISRAPAQGQAAVTARVIALLIGALTTLGCTDSSGARRDAGGIRLGRPRAVAERASIGAARDDGPVLELLDRHESRTFKRSAAEIVDYDPASRRVFVVDAGASSVRVLELGPRGFEGSARQLEPREDLPGFDAGEVTSLAVHGSLLAVTVGAASNDRRGRLVFYSPEDLRCLGATAVGYDPDMVTFTPDGQVLLVANEGEQVRNEADRIVSDPRGSVSIVDISSGVEQPQVTQVGFEAFDARIEEYRGVSKRGRAHPAHPRSRV